MALPAKQKVCDKVITKPFALGQLSLRTRPALSSCLVGNVCGAWEPFVAHLCPQRVLEAPGLPKQLQTPGGSACVLQMAVPHAQHVLWHRVPEQRLQHRRPACACTADIWSAHVDSVSRAPAPQARGWHHVCADAQSVHALRPA